MLLSALGLLVCLGPPVHPGTDAPVAAHPAVLVPAQTASQEQDTVVKVRRTKRRRVEETEDNTPTARDSWRGPLAFGVAEVSLLTVASPVYILAGLLGTVIAAVLGPAAVVALGMGGPVMVLGAAWQTSTLLAHALLVLAAPVLAVLPSLLLGRWLDFKPNWPATLVVGWLPAVPTLVAACVVSLASMTVALGLWAFGLSREMVWWGVNNPAVANPALMQAGGLYGLALGVLAGGQATTAALALAGMLGAGAVTIATAVLTARGMEKERTEDQPAEPRRPPRRSKRPRHAEEEDAPFRAIPDSENNEIIRPDSPEEDGTGSPAPQPDVEDPILPPDAPPAAPPGPSSPKNEPTPALPPSPPMDPF